MTSWSSYRNLYRAHGFKRVWTHLKESTFFDWWRGTDTETWLPLSAYSTKDSDMKHYQASFTSEAVRALQLAGKGRDLSGWHFYDIGCGKGKILILAAEILGMKAVTGIELSAELAAICRSNIKKAGIQAEVVEANARDFSTYAPHALIYLCDPFGEETFRAVLGHLKAACRECVLIYNNPVYDPSPFGFEKQLETSGWHANYRTGIYRLTAS